MTEAPKTSVVRGAVLLAAFLLPVGYVAGIFAVAIHEILGHGLAAVALGGEFSGFVLRWDTMGWAYSELPQGVAVWHYVFHLGSGVIATTVSGGVLLGLGLLFRKRTDIQLPLLLVSLICLMDGIPYIFWNAYHPVPPGDIGWILRLLGPSAP